MRCVLQSQNKRASFCFRFEIQSSRMKNQNPANSDDDIIEIEDLNEKVEPTVRKATSGWIKTRLNSAVKRKTENSEPESGVSESDKSTSDSGSELIVEMDSEVDENVFEEKAEKQVQTKGFARKHTSAYVKVNTQVAAKPKINQNDNGIKEALVNNPKRQTARKHTGSWARSVQQAVKITVDKCEESDDAESFEGAQSPNKKPKAI